MNSNARIAYLISQYPYISHTFILREIIGLRKRGFDIATASINDADRPPEQLTPEEQEESRKTFYIKHQGILSVAKSHLFFFARSPLSYFKGLMYALHLGGADLFRLLYCFFYFAEAVMVAQWMKKIQSRHLHVHFATQVSTVALIASKIDPITFSLMIHGTTEFYDVSKFSLPEKIKCASFIFCISKYTKSQLMLISDPRYWNKIELCPLGVDVNIFKPKHPAKRASPFHAIYVSRLVPGKGHDILLAAMNRLQGRSLRLCLVGDGPERSRLEKSVKDQGLTKCVVFEGAINQDRIRELYAASDLFVHPSFAEGLPVVLMEAMAMEIPCIATAITGVPELIQDRENGILVPPADENALAKAIAELIDEVGLRRRLAAAGRRRILQAFNLDLNLDRLAGMLNCRMALRHGS